MSRADWIGLAVLVVCVIGAYAIDGLTKKKPESDQDWEDRQW
jgi:hypothetical protein